MRASRWIIGFFLVFGIVRCVAKTDKQLTVTGTLTRVMAIGAETSGWAIEFDSEKTIGGKQFKSIEIVYANNERLEKLKDKRVRATGKLDTRAGVESGERSVLNVTSIQQTKAAPAESGMKGFDLIGSEWKLDDLAGEKVMDRVQATLLFRETGKVAGKGSCNRFSGSAEISGNSIKFGPLISTRMACPEPIMNQETKYLGALQTAERFEWKKPHLLVYSKGAEKPLQFTRMSAPKPVK
jgi:heat shock protein HslJ